ncbi:unnamed protein product [Phytomonas sp. EM1]|nr:unnamed protein product [Phytomonas sp. EM1]|eukprot:CCW65185.1 unnamed protein product [Phytomonas sp. isolate EM1]
MEEKGSVESLEFRGRSEYIEQHGSTLNTPSHLYSSCFLIKQSQHGANARFYASGVSSSCSMQSFYGYTAPYAEPLHNLRKHCRHRQQTVNPFVGSFQGDGARHGGKPNNS